MQTLNSCLSQLTISADKNSGAGDAQGGEEGDGTDAEMKIKEETLRKIQAMLDTTKVHILCMYMQLSWYVFSSTYVLCVHGVLYVRKKLIESTTINPFTHFPSVKHCH